MRIKYKEPYWAKFTWEVDSHHDNQYVTSFDKIENRELKNFLLKSEYAITVSFKIKKIYKKDDISMIFGKPGKNLGLSYNESSKTMAFEFWTDEQEEDKFYFLPLLETNENEIDNGITITVVRDGNKMILYKNFIENNSIEFNGNLIHDYTENSLFIGCSSPECASDKHRYYGEIDITFFSIILKTTNIETIQDYLKPNEIHVLPFKKCYDDILCYYDFKTINNIGIVYDESKNLNFLEKVPSDFVL
jgi:hypothetical protein